MLDELWKRCRARLQPVAARCRKTLSRNAAHARSTARASASGRRHLHDLAALCGPDDVPVSARQLQAVRRAIEQLPWRSREVFLMSQVDRLSFAEIGQQLQLSRRSVSNAMVIAIAAVAAALGESDQDACS